MNYEVPHYEAFSTIEGHTREKYYHESFALDNVVDSTLYVK
jgi:hypothetical protein